MMYGLLRRYIDLHVREYYFLQWLIHDESMLTFDYLHTCHGFQITLYLPCLFCATKGFRVFLIEIF
jgi:hypothetical protein